MIVGRRSLIAGMAISPAIAAAKGLAAPSPPDPRHTARGFAKLQGDLRSDVITPWWYDATIYGIVAGAEPRLLLRAEGCETYILRPETDGSFLSRGVTVTAFKDPTTGEWLDSFDNPMTGQRDIVRPNVITGVSTLYPADGSAPRLNGSNMRPSQIAPGGADKAQPEGWLRWIESAEQIGCVNERRSRGPIQPFMETASMWSDRQSFFDPAQPRVEATFTSTFLSPWLAWMGMSKQAGHMLWHSTGRKLRSLSELPMDFASRAEQLAPGRLRANPFLEARRAPGGQSTDVRGG